jgi:hypothetical protein
MATNVKTGAMGFPYPMGKVFPGASYATVSVPLTQNIIPTKTNGVDGTEVPDYQFNGVWIQANPDNTGYIYVCSNASAPDTTNYTNVLGFLSAGQWFPRVKEWANNRDISKLYVGAANATDFAIVVIDAF